MIVGNGDIATSLKLSMRPYDERFVFFASGVSNSKETDEDEYLREKRLLLQQDTKKHLVYFSSLAVFDGTSRYVEHKKEMEIMVRAVLDHYTIIRLGNITWGNNPHTLINYFKNKIKTSDNWMHEVQDVYRYVVEEPEFLHWIELIPDWNCEMSIIGRMMKVEDIIAKYVLV